MGFRGDRTPVRLNVPYHTSHPSALNLILLYQSLATLSSKKFKKFKKFFLSKNFQSAYFVSTHLARVLMKDTLTTKVIF